MVYPEKMLANLNMSGGLIFSQRILLALVDGKPTGWIGEVLAELALEAAAKL